ncbi:MAG: ATP-grasp domain-containing protein [Nitrospinae bacterium]|nr:ATP-grasp domain-containing protein [Nitrospinota bacterium]
MKRVCFVGAHVRPWMENAARHGYQVTAVDGFNDWDARFFGSLVEPEAPARDASLLARFSGLPKEVPVIFCSPVESFPDFVEKASETRRVFNSPPPAVLKSRDFGFLRKFAGDGISAPEFEADADGRARQGWIIKQAKSAGGAGVRKDDGVLREGEYRQKFVEGGSVGAIFFSSGSGTKFCGVAAHINEGYRFAGCVYPAEADPEALGAVARFGQRFAEAVELVGWWGADFILGEGAPNLLEVNPRFTAGMELMARAHGIDLAGTQAAAFSGDKCHFDMGPNLGYHGRRVVYAGKNTVFKNPGKWFKAGMRDVPPDGAALAKGAPVLSIYAGGGIFSECLENLRTTRSGFERELYGE